MCIIQSKAMFYVMEFVDQREFHLSRLRFSFSFVTLILLRSRFWFYIRVALHIVVPSMRPKLSLFNGAVETIERFTLTATGLECKGV